jgi:hypothetical protein
MVTLFCGVGTSGTHRERLVVATGFGWRRMLAVGSSGGRRLASVVPAASHEKGERLGTVDGGEGWLAAGITENGVAAVQGTGGGERFESAQLRPA